MSENPVEINIVNNVDDDKLVDVRCPFENTSKSDGKIYVCNRVCVQVMPGSSGKARCRSCRMYFLFDINKDSKPATGIRVKKLESEVTEEEN